MIEIYIMTSCPYCKVLKQELENNNIPFKLTHLDNFSKYWLYQGFREVAGSLSTFTYITDPNIKNTTARNAVVDQNFNFLSFIKSQDTINLYPGFL